MKKYIWVLSLIIFFGACKNDKMDNDKSPTTTNTPAKVGPTFDENSAYAYIEKQLSFGPRVPGTAAQKAMADWMEGEMKTLFDTVYRQETTLTLGDGQTKVPCINLIGSINPSATRRILLLAHWDTRPWADHDFKDVDKPIMGADDGASGVGVLLAIAKAIQSQKLPEGLGIDVLMSDVEDYAKSEWGDDAYALGTQYWARNPHIPGYTAQAGILLDMVGGKDARFAIEAFSQHYARAVVTSVWDAADKAGYGKYFVYENGGGITDDHIPVNEIAKIPTIDIINQPIGSSTGFVGHWHTHDDNISVIDKATLKAVGQTVIQYLYSL